MFPVAPGCSVGCQVYSYCSSSHTLHHLHWPCPAFSHLCHVDLEPGSGCPLTHFTIFTDRVLRSVICAMWIWNLVVAGISNQSYLCTKT